MSHDTNTNALSPEGRIFQVEYAMKSVTLSTTVLAIRTAEGLVFAAERRVGSSLRIQQDYEKVQVIDDHAQCVVAGYVSDSRTLLSTARAEAQNHRFSYNEYIPLHTLAESLSDTLINFGKGRNKLGRPFGCGLLIGGYDGLVPQMGLQRVSPAGLEGLGEEAKVPGPACAVPEASGTQPAHSEVGPVARAATVPVPSLYSADPSGTVVSVLARAMGAGSVTAQEILQDEYKEDFTLEQGVSLALRVLKNVMESPLSEENVELAYTTYDQAQQRLRSVYVKGEALAAEIRKLGA